MVYGEEFSKDYVLKAGVTRNVSDDHNWWSIFSRPVRSRFNRKQRVSVCMAMLMLTVVSCGMYYNGTETIILDPLTHLGPIPLDARDVTKTDKALESIRYSCISDACWIVLQSDSVPANNHHGVPVQKRKGLDQKNQQD